MASLQGKEESGVKETRFDCCCVSYYRYAEDRFMSVSQMTVSSNIHVHTHALTHTCTHTHMHTVVITNCCCSQPFSGCSCISQLYSTVKSPELVSHSKFAILQ